MKYKCSICGKVVSDDLKVYINHTEEHVVDVIKKDHPDWVEKDGMCHQCEGYYRKQIKGDTDK